MGNISSYSTDATYMTVSRVRYPCPLPPFIPPVYGGPQGGRKKLSKRALMKRVPAKAGDGEEKFCKINSHEPRAHKRAEKYTILPLFLPSMGLSLPTFPPEPRGLQFPLKKGGFRGLFKSFELIALYLFCLSTDILYSIFFIIPIFSFIILILFISLCNNPLTPFSKGEFTRLLFLFDLNSHTIPEIFRRIYYHLVSRFDAVHYLYQVANL